MPKNFVFSTDSQTHKRQCAMLLIRREINSLCSSVLCRCISMSTICEVSASNRRGINRREREKTRCVNDRRRNASRRKPECETKRCEKFKLMPCRRDYSLSRCRCCVCVCFFFHSQLVPHSIVLSARNLIAALL